ncbi:MAG: hypothetical protein ACLU62_12940 [Hydrogeniiclostridium sp.]
MKKILCMLLACVLCISTLGGCQGEQKEPWTLEDFSIYDEDGNLVEELPEHEMIVSSKDHLYTKRKIHPDMKASEIAKVYPLENAIIRNNMDVEKTIEWQKKYKTVEDLLNSGDKFDFNDDAIEYIQIVVAFTEQNGKLEPITEYSNGYPVRNKDKNYLEMVFWINEELEIDGISMDYKQK